MPVLESQSGEVAVKDCERLFHCGLFEQRRKGQPENKGEDGRRVGTRVDVTIALSPASSA